jgi:hypothetical protein
MQMRATVNIDRAASTIAIQGARYPEAVEKRTTL